MPRTKTIACISAVLVIGGASALALATPAFAQQSPTSAQQSVTVNYGELNLNANEGADTLIRRVEHAADIVCGDYAGVQNMRERASIGRCELISTRAAIQEVGHPVVMSRYYGRRPDVTIESSAEPEMQTSSVVVAAR